MTLHEAATAPEALRGLARMVREGVRYGRGARMKVVRRFYKPQVKQMFRRQPRPKPGVSLAKQAASGLIFRKGPITVNCEYPRPEGLSLPKTWSARFVERITFPVLRKSAGEFDRHPFGLCLEVGRGSRRITIYVHDARKAWLGPTFKATLRRFAPPWTPPLAPSTFLVVDDALSEASLLQWLTVILAQRSLLTEDEEWAAVKRFFLRDASDDEEREVRREAYEVLKRRFLQPPGGRPSFPLYYKRTLRMLRAQQRARDGDLFALRDSELLSLKELRWSEPNLHRALLDRVADGRVEPIAQNGLLWVTQEAAQQVDDERTRNAEARQPKCFPGKRIEWIDALVRAGENTASARRKIKRWINQLGLSEEEVQASIRRGRVVRRPRRSIAR